MTSLGTFGEGTVRAPSWPYLRPYGAFREGCERLPPEIERQLIGSCTTGAETRHAGPPFEIQDTERLSGLPRGCESSTASCHTSPGTRFMRLGVVMAISMFRGRSCLLAPRHLSTYPPGVGPDQWSVSDEFRALVAEDQARRQAIPPIRRCLLRLLRRLSLALSQMASRLETLPSPLQSPSPNRASFWRPKAVFLWRLVSKSAKIFNPVTSGDMSGLYIGPIVFRN
jgi:hypothetical protein